MAHRSVVLEAEELKSKLFTRLKKDGKLDALRASMRSEVIKCFYAEGMNKKDRLNKTAAVDDGISESNELKITNGLIEEHLLRNHYDFTRSVFNLECGNPRVEQRGTWLNISEVLNTLNIQLSSDLGAELVSAFSDVNDRLFLWKLLQARVSESNKEVVSPKVNESSIDDDLKNIVSRPFDNLHRKMKMIDEIYDHKKQYLTSESKSIHSNQAQHFNATKQIQQRITQIGGNSKEDGTHLRKSLFSENLTESVMKNNINSLIQKTVNVNDQMNYNDRQLNGNLLLIDSDFQFEKKRLLKLQNDIEIREKELALQKENFTKDRLNWESKKIEIDLHFTNMNHLQKTLEMRERQIEMREHQLSQRLLEDDWHKAEAQKNDELEKEHYVSLKKEYEGKLADSLNQIRHLQNKLLSMEGLYQHEKMKNIQQINFLNTQLRLQEERNVFLQGCIKDLQRQSSIRNFQLWKVPFNSSQYTKASQRVEPIFGADLQGTYFDTSFNASNLPPELELEKQYDEVNFEDLSTIHSCLRNLDNEADRLENTYSKLEREKYVENSKEFRMMEEKNTKVRQVIFDDSSFYPKTPNASLLQNNYFSTTFESNSPIKTFQSSARNLQTEKQNEPSINKTLKLDVNYNENRDRKFTEVEENLKQSEDLKISDTPINKSVDVNFETKLSLSNQDGTVTENISEKFINSIDNLEKSVHSVSVSQRSSTPIESPSLQVPTNKNDNEISQVVDVQQHISWEKVSNNSDNEFEW